MIATALAAMAPAVRAAESQQRWALLVGVGDNANAANVLQGPSNDVAAMTDLLCGRYSFPRDHVHVLLDAKATRAGILSGWDWLRQRVRAGDQVVFYYSGHGIDVPDPTKPSGRDSAICPFDALRVSGLITGREIGERIDRLPTDRIVAIVDACCSATATRDIRSHSRSPNPATFGLPPHTRDTDTAAAGSSPVFAPAPGGHLQKERYIGAARIDQSAHECPFLSDDRNGSGGGSAPRDSSHDANPNMGALTFFLLKELRADPDGRLSYDDLTRKVRGDLAAIFTNDPQEPQASGPGLNLPFLAFAEAKAARSSGPLPIAAARSAGGVGATVQLRALAGAALVSGAVLQGTGGRKWTEVGGGGAAAASANPAEASALVRVTTVTGSAAVGVVIAGAVFDGAPLTEVMHPEPNGRLLVAIAGDDAFAERLRRALAGVAGVTVVAPTRASGVTLYPSSRAGMVDIDRRGVSLPAIRESDVPATIVGLQKVERLADLQSDPGAAIHVSIRTTDGKESYSEARVGDRIGYQITVDHDAYLTILDIAADGSITGATLPGLQEAGVPFALAPSLVTPPGGLDTLKVIATTFPVQFLLPANKDAADRQSGDGQPEAVARRVLSVLQAGAAAALRSSGADARLATKMNLVQTGADNGAIAAYGWAAADMLLRVDP